MGKPTIVDRNKNGTFKKGVIANPGGRPKLPVEIKKLRTLRSREIQICLLDYLQQRKSSLKAIQNDSTTSALNLIIAGFILRCMTGDLRAVSALFELTIGPNEPPAAFLDDQEAFKDLEESFASTS